MLITPPPTTSKRDIRGREETWGSRGFVTCANSCAVTRGARILSRAGTLYHRIRIFAFDSAAPACAQVEGETLPARLRRRTINGPTPRAKTATKEYRSRELATHTDTSQGASIWSGCGMHYRYLAVTRSPTTDRFSPSRANSYRAATSTTVGTFASFAANGSSPAPRRSCRLSRMRHWRLIGIRR